MPSFCVFLINHTVYDINLLIFCESIYLDTANSV